MSKSPVRLLMAIAMAASLAGCASEHRQPQSGGPQHCDQEWHSPIAMLLRYADKNGNLTRAELNAGLRKDFDAADTNHDGVLEMDEVRAVNNRRWSEDAAATSPLVDWNRDGVVDFDEYSATARSLFDQLDVDGKGVLTAQQLRPPCGKGKADGGGEQGGGPGGAEHRGHRGGRGGGPGGDDDGDGQ
ncbi:MAG: EF-hand domain-containing protein [Alphaproteobacteria bacterium]|nr:EF-hand domain-containing protein [Alphaproteobacteria bacterium]MDE2267381.1 EF-hand domain-containing protein [Alphaproteobacteria bacterium]MDE2498934.1 EF-hand domain-containing protein [Alphaproteobacteria bacterium]